MVAQSCSLLAGPSLSNGDPKTLEHRHRPRRFSPRFPPRSPNSHESSSRIPITEFLSYRTFAISIHDRSIDPRIRLVEQSQAG